MSLIAIRGRAALPEFRRQQLAAAISNELELQQPVTVEANYLYLVQFNNTPDTRTLATLSDLLHASTTPVTPNGISVMPRKGTISPWSTRVRDVLHNNGITQIRRIERGIHYNITTQGRELSAEQLAPALPALHDRMTEGVYPSLTELFATDQPREGRTFNLLQQGRAALEEANSSMGLALSDDELDYLLNCYQQAGRNPTDTELLMFGQVNSEHCRHKIFNASWIIDGAAQPLTLFKMIKNTHACHPEGTLVAYADNAGVAAGSPVDALYINPDNKRYELVPDQIDILMKAETHNHPTAISPFPGAATGTGGEIRDEAATGTGGRSLAGFSGYIVSNLNIPGFAMPWEKEIAPFPFRLASPLQIMLEGPLGAATFGNEFGRPQLCGFFRTYEDQVAGLHRGYHKPIMMGGGIGAIRRSQVSKKPIPPSALVVQLGGPSILIGLGGGAASSLATSGVEETLDFDSVQRGNAEVERRCQEVIDACVAMGENNPILSIHDVGAGGLSNACPELVEETGATFQLRDIPCEDPGMSPMEIWCCESQERYVLAIMPESRKLFETLCQRERCPVAFIGTTRNDQRLVLEDSLFNNNPIDMAVSTLLGNPPTMVRDVTRVKPATTPLDLSNVNLEEAFKRILNLPAVADKSFLITIADRSVGGLVARDQMVGPWQLPLADCAVTATSFNSYAGSCIATGERTPLALIDGPASGRMAVGEAITNCAGAAIGSISRIKLSANWMCACGEPGEDASLFDTVHSVGMEFCPALGLSIPVGKDSLSMRTTWHDAAGEPHHQTSPLSLIISAFARVNDVRATVTPDLKPSPCRLLLIDLGNGANRLGGSALAQVYNQLGSEAPDCDDPARLRSLFDAMQELVANNLILAYHDRSDGGTAITLAEMAISSGLGITANLKGNDPLSVLFSEELGGVIQVATDNLAAVHQVLERHGLAPLTHDIGTTTSTDNFELSLNGIPVLQQQLSWIRREWSALSYHLKSLRDNPASATQEYDNTLTPESTRLTAHLTFDPNIAPSTSTPPTKRPRVALLRDQGGSGHTEMGAALTLAGFDVTDLHITDLVAGRRSLAEFCGLIACGDATYGDAPAPGVGWAATIMLNLALRQSFTEFFNRPNTFTLGVCNGAQMLSALKELIPGANHWPTFERNLSDSFEARYVTVEVCDSPSLLLKGMGGSRLPVVASHGSGLVHYSQPSDSNHALVALRYVDAQGDPTERYPLNPNGSAAGATAFTTTDGRATIMMVHPERGFRSVQMSYRPENYPGGEAGPWLRLFQNAYNLAIEQNK